MTPLVIAHRGANDEEPEHSLAAYLLALEQGADGIECDVRLTADGVLVCVHDRTIGRTSTGRGTVSAQRLDELAQHDYSDGDRWHDFDEPPAPERWKLLTLETLLSAALDVSSTVTFSIETKHPTRYGGYVERELATMLARFGLLDGQPRPRVRVMSFSWWAVRRIGQIMPALPAVYLMDRIPWPYRDGSLPHRASIAGLSIEQLHRDPDCVARIHARGHEVHVWTVDAPDDVALCLRLGVDAIISNRPGAVRAIVGE